MEGTASLTRCTQPCSLSGTPREGWGGGTAFQKVAVVCHFLFSHCRLGSGLSPGTARDLRLQFPWRRKWQPTPLFLRMKSHRHRSLVGYGVTKELDVIWQLNINNNKESSAQTIWMRNSRRCVDPSQHQLVEEPEK